MRLPSLALLGLLSCAHSATEAPKAPQAPARLTVRRAQDQHPMGALSAPLRPAEHQGSGCQAPGERLWVTQSTLHSLSLCIPATLAPDQRLTGRLRLSEDTLIKDPYYTGEITATAKPAADGQVMVYFDTIVRLAHRTQFVSTLDSDTIDKAVDFHVEGRLLLLEEGS